MCGIAGIVEPGRPGQLSQALAMADLLAHRGPDDSDAWGEPGVALGFRRLAILDLSADGRQPMADETGRYRLVFNGEIYNYLELRAELEGCGHRFRSQTDSEVLLAAYIEWGPACVRRMNGMWAFAVWDSRERTLFCSRDRFGIKPFYYRGDPRRFVFASELKAFRADAQPLLPNEAMVRDYLEDGHSDHTTSTFFRGVQQLAPAHSLLIGPGGLSIESYWRLEQRDPPDDPIAATRELFVDSVRRHLQSDVPVGTCLSGGLDSSAIAVTVAHLLGEHDPAAAAVGPRQRTVTAFFEEPRTDERQFARAVVTATGAEPHWVTFSGSEVADVLPSIVATQDEPFGSTSIVAQWYVMRTAHEAGLTVMLDGQGGDETFAGYHTSFGPRFADLLLRGHLRELISELRAYCSAHSMKERHAALLLARAIVPYGARRRVRASLTRAGLSPAGRLVHPDLRPLSPTKPFVEYAYPDRLRRTLERQFSEWGLRELLRYEDRNSMAHSIEARVPFLDYRLVELAFSLGGRDLIDHGVTKAVVRRALGHLLPPIVRDRIDKLGFVTPERSWMKGSIGDLAAEVFHSREFASRGFVDVLKAQRLLMRHRTGEVDASRTLWRALNLELWAREFLDAPGRVARSLTPAEAR
jgi:asparagine synthase (glutamine-hydrolysing)